MSKFLRLLLIPIILYSASARGALSSVDKAEIFNKQILKNGGFESAKASWTASGGTFATTTSAPMEGLSHATWDASATGQTLTSTAAPIPPGWYGRNGAVSCIFKTASGLATHEIQAFDGTNILSEVTVTSSASPTRTSANFVFPSSGNISLRIFANQDEPSNFAIDDCYLGPADGFNLSQISQASLVASGYFNTTASCTFTRTSTSLGALSDADCPGATVEFNPGPGTLQTTDFDAPKFTLNNLPPGNYIVGFSGGALVTTTAQYSAMSVSDGTTTSGQQGWGGGTTFSHFQTEGVFSYTGAGNRTFELFASSAANAVNIDVNANNIRLSFYIKRFPLTSEMSFNPDVAAFKLDANIIGTNPSLGVASVSSYTEITGASLTMVQNTGSTLVQIPCSATNPSTGLTCAAGSEGLGAAFTIPRAGTMKICAEFAWQMNASSASGTARAAFQLVETANASQTILQEGKSRIPAGSADVDIQTFFPINLCGTFTFASAGLKTIRAMYEQGVSGAGPTTSSVATDQDSNQGQQDFHITGEYIDQNVAAPLLVNGVVSAHAGVLNICSGLINDAGTAAVTRSLGNCAASVSDNSTGDYTVNFAAGTFSSTPDCTCTATDNSGSMCIIDTTTAPSSSLVRFQNFNGSAVVADRGFNFICTGPKQ